MFGSGSRINYQHTVEGTWGQFITPAGEVDFLLTKARLGREGIDNERRLTSQLRPVREVLDTEKLNFNQLLQRDLDDHRVATQLIPYLLRPEKTGPAFFPPIMTVLLPFSGQHPIDTFPQEDYSGTNEDEQLKQVYWNEIRSANAFRIRRMSDADGNFHEIKLGQVSWNDEAAKLVVLDGQHRAMALIAIDRTINGAWDKNSGARFRHFYENRIQSILEEASQRGEEIDLGKIEIPVIVCWFPTKSEAAKNPHGAARKLFVDVNKEARQPSEARLILLSDTELINVFTRCLLNRLREDSPPFPLYAIEYDNPEDSSQPVRWSAMANLSLLKRVIEYTVFCQSKYRKDMEVRFGGRPSEYDMDARMREELELNKIFPATLEEENLKRNAIGNKRFPLRSLELLRQQFMKGWGTSILNIFGNLKPYKAHINALQKLRNDWILDDAVASLASDAIFNGVGMYWTLRESSESWENEIAQLKTDHQTVPNEKPDIVKAWDIIQGKSNDFQAIRANFYLGKATSDAIKAANSAFDMMNTQACQLGACLMLTTLADSMEKKMEEIVELTREITEALNAALSTSITQSRNRLLIFSREEANPLNRLPRLNPVLSIHFRYFWLELLCTPESRKYLSNELFESAQKYRNLSRRVYLDFLIDLEKKSLARTNPDWKDGRISKEAEESQTKFLRKAMKHWAIEDLDKFDQWLANQSTDQSTANSTIVDDESIESEPIEEESSVEDDSLDDVLSSLSDDD